MGLIYCICRTNCEVWQKCCKCFIDLEKEDKNLDYGTYYYADDGERRQDVMEVAFDINSIDKLKYECFKMEEKQNISGSG